MAIVTTSRRSFLGGVLGLMAAPVIVRVSSLMPVKSWAEPFDPGKIKLKIYYGTKIALQDVTEISDLMNQMSGFQGILAGQYGDGRFHGPVVDLRSVS